MDCTIQKCLLAQTGTPVQGQRGLEGLCQWPMFRDGIIKGFRLYVLNVSSKVQFLQKKVNVCSLCAKSSQFKRGLACSPFLFLHSVFALMLISMIASATTPQFTFCNPSRGD